MYEDEYNKIASSSPATDLSQKTLKSMESSLHDRHRHSGETQDDYRHRMAQSDEVRNLSGKEKEIVLAKIRGEQGGKSTAVRLDRADGGKSILAYLDHSSALDATNGIPSSFSRKDYYEVVNNHPFKVKQLSTYSTTGVWLNTKLGVYSGSSLYDSMTPNSGLGITGLITGTGVNATGWTAYTGGDFVAYLKISFNTSGDITSSQIIIDALNSTFDTSKSAWEAKSFLEKTTGNTPTQNIARVLLAEISGSAQNPSIEQRVRADLVMRDVAVDGYPARYPMPA
jgi:hypothetical protein